MTGLPPDVETVVFGDEGKVRHVLGKDGRVLCHMLFETRPATMADYDKPICGACVRTLPARVMIREGEKGC